VGEAVVGESLETVVGEALVGESSETGVPESSETVVGLGKSADN
jgi:hypothetical protein